MGEKYMNVQKIKHHIESLKTKHSDLEAQIQEAYIHYDPDEKVKDLKIKKLQVKKEIEWLEKEIAEKAN
jgi:hypothetical protein